nr:dephospho-CoA kinase [bacterium]
MRVIGIVGGIGSGKSTVAGYFAARGVPVLDADAIYHELTLPGEACWQALVAAFGRGILAPDGELDRPALAKVVFADDKQRAHLNEITHPIVRREIVRRLELLRRSGTKWALIDAPLLYEGGLDSLCDQVWGVFAPMETRIARVMQRSGLTREQVIGRMNSQMADDQLAERVNHRIDNGGTLQETQAALHTLWMEAGKGEETA